MNEDPNSTIVASMAEALAKLPPLPDKIPVSADRAALIATRAELCEVQDMLNLAMYLLREITKTGEAVPEIVWEAAWESLQRQYENKESIRDRDRRHPPDPCRRLHLLQRTDP